MQRKAIFIAATGQNVGKTTICLGLISGLKKRFPQLGFIKPVGQQHVTVKSGLKVDKDVVLFKEYFNLPDKYEDMSPVIFPSGFTRDYLDGKVNENILKANVLSSFNNIVSQNDFTIVEGTGHIGVGSIVNLNNAEVAAALGLDMVLIVKGGIGSAYDELALNKALCDRVGVKWRGVILNRVQEEKKEMIIHYTTKALSRWNIPLIGCITYNKFLNTPSMEDFEFLFNTTLLSGEKYHYCHFETIRLVATSVETFRELMIHNQLIVTHATREDIMQALIEGENANRQPKPKYGIILTGRYPPSSKMIQQLQTAQIPCLYTPKATFDAMKMITSFTAKIRKEDITKVEKAIQVVEKNIQFELITD